MKCRSLTCVVVGALLVSFAVNGVDCYAGWFSKKPVESIKPAAVSKVVQPAPAPVMPSVYIFKPEGTNSVFMAMITPDNQVKISPRFSEDQVILRFVELLKETEERNAKQNELRIARERITAKVLTDLLSIYSGVIPAPAPAK